MRILSVLLILLAIAACGRPLTTAERDFMAGFQGDSFDPGPVRIHRNPFVGISSRSYPARPRTTCRELILPPPETPVVTGRTAGIALFQHLHTSPGFFLDDYVLRDDGALNLTAAMFFAHEMTHVWQWQNRAVTGYHPTRAFAEHLTTEDPYLFDGDSDFAFLEYGYEQQASLVEEYACCRALDPGGARTLRLERLLREVMPLDQRLEYLDDRDILLPWDGAEIRGICS
ncbi:hypothetical protein HKCCE2091_19610 [Rhodobacterales bacterium HKCCE2091]|nr:hypothetical protein [Rhodobacterales bacterium HKCCE2091]